MLIWQGRCNVGNTINKAGPGRSKPSGGARGVLAKPLFPFFACRRRRQKDVATALRREEGEELNSSAGLDGHGDGDRELCEIGHTHIEGADAELFGATFRVAM
jgi:hypothetical protein